MPKVNAALDRVLFVRCGGAMHARLVALACRRKVTLAQLVRALLDEGLPPHKKVSRETVT